MYHNKIINYLLDMEQQGYRIEFERTESNPNGNEFSIIRQDDTLHFVGVIGHKTLGDWIKIHGKAA